MSLSGSQIALVTLIVICIGILSFLGYKIYEQKKLYDDWQKEVECSGIKSIWCWFQTNIIGTLKEHKGTASISTGIIGTAGCLGAVVFAFGTGGFGTPAIAVCGLTGAGLGVASHGFLGGTPASAFLGIAGGVAPLITGAIFAIAVVFIASSIFGIETVFKIPYIWLFLAIVGFVAGLMLWEWVYSMMPIIIGVLVVGIVAYLYFTKKH